MVPREYADAIISVKVEKKNEKFYWLTKIGDGTQQPLGRWTTIVIDSTDSKCQTLCDCSIVGIIGSEKQKIRANQRSDLSLVGHADLFASWLS